MSSIFGIFSREGATVEKAALEKMQQKLSYWKADRSKIWCKNAMGMGQLMLCVTPESLKEHLPFTEGNLTITANARIDNRDEVFRQLNLRQSLAELTDSYLILQAYLKWGEHCPKYLKGEFAFSIWDEQSKTLFCAKDAIGVRPLYYCITHQNFIFSSEIGGILASGLVEKGLNDFMLAIHLVGFKGEKEQTSFKNILILPPAHWIKVTPEQVKKERYWDVNLDKTLRLKDSASYEEAFRFYMKQAITRATRSAFPIASFLSGGLDSTSITGITLKEKIAPKPLYLYSWAHPEGDTTDYEDDREYIETFLDFHHQERNSFSHEYLHGSEGYFSLLPKLQPFYDEPFRDLEHYTRFQSYERAREVGVRTILSGVGGDEFVSSFGYEHIVGLFLKMRWGKAANELLQIKKARGYGFKGTLKKELIKPLRLLFQGKETWGRGAIDAGRSFLENKRNRYYINPHLKNELNFEQLIEEHLDQGLLRHPFFDPVRQRHYLNLHDGHLDISFNQRYQASLAYGMVYNYPLLDRDLVEFCLNIPSDQFHQNGQGRSLIRRAMKNYVPQNILIRNTKYATSPHMLRRIHSEEQLMMEMIERGERNSLVRRYIDLKSLKTDFDPFLRGRLPFNADFIRTFYLINFLTNYK